MATPRSTWGGALGVSNSRAVLLGMGNRCGAAVLPRYMGRFEVGGWQPWAFGAMLVAAVLEDLRLSYAVIAVELQLPEVADGCGQR